jgi:hypothetical protein
MPLPDPFFSQAEEQLVKKISFIVAAPTIAVFTLAVACADLQQAIGDHLASTGSHGDGPAKPEDCADEAEHGSETEDGHGGEADHTAAPGGECGGDGPTGADLADSCCGFPGDRGNELGVGQFCTRDEHCAGNVEAKVCSSFENGLTDHVSFFCTIPCDPNVEEDVCGTGARCNCEEVGCGCVPVACLENAPAHCEEP